MNILLLLGAIIIGIILLGMAIMKGSRIIRVIAFIATVCCFFLCFILGVDWEKFRNYETCIYRFSLYSRHLHDLADHQQIGQLTNDIILFDNKFNAHQDPTELQDVMVQILRPKAVEVGITNKLQ